MTHFMLKISMQELIIHPLLKGTQTHQSFLTQILVQENSFMNSLLEYWYNNSLFIPYSNIGKLWLLMKRCNKKTLHPYSRACPQEWTLVFKRTLTMHLDPLYTQHGVKAKSHPKNMGPTSHIKFHNLWSIYGVKDRDPWAMIHKRLDIKCTF